MGAGASSVNRPCAAARSLITLSVIRSCSSAAIASSSAGSSAGAAPSSPGLNARWYSVMRSIRRTASPQLWAMSVAFDAQGETVPNRGVTTSVTAPPGRRHGSP